MDGQFYLGFFPQPDVETIARIVEIIREERVAFVQRWHERSLAQFGPHRAYCDTLFQEGLVPYLRGAVVRLAAGDTEGFVTFAGILGEHLARTGAPFAALVAHLHLLKESAIEVIGERVGVVDPQVVRTIDKLNACCIGAAADGFFGGRNGHAPAVASGDHRAGERHEPPARPQPFHGMVGSSAAMRRIFTQITRIAATAWPVLICGETGTGKELIARAIHAAGARRTGPFVAVNCAALPRELIESELFGYRKGAFSGAQADHVGLFRAATGGTLLLDEITEMSGELQAKLLRVVQEMTVRPVGAVAEVPLDVRIIASTNRDPAAALACGTLRADLYYRLSVGVIHVPPLRQRPDDIEPLIAHQLAVLNERSAEAGQGRRAITAAAARALCGARWPGNVRELFNVLESAFTAAHADWIDVEDLTLPEAERAAGVPGHAVPETFAQGERALIERALTSAGGNKRRAAQALGISRKKLYARLAKYAMHLIVASPMLVASIDPPAATRAPRRLARPAAVHPLPAGRLV